MFCDDKKLFYLLGHTESTLKTVSEDIIKKLEQEQDRGMK